MSKTKAMELWRLLELVVGANTAKEAPANKMFVFKASSSNTVGTLFVF